MEAEAIIAALVGVAAGGGGRSLFGRLWGPERDEAIASYYRKVIAGLQAENDELRGLIIEVREHNDALELRIEGLELAQDMPPPELA